MVPEPQRHILYYPSNIDASTSHDSGGAVEMHSPQQFVRAAPVVNDRTGISIITVQSLVARVTVILGANPPIQSYCWCIREVTKGDPQPPLFLVAFQPLTIAGGFVAVIRKVESLLAARAESDVGVLVSSIGSCA